MLFAAIFSSSCVLVVQASFTRGAYMRRPGPEGPAGRYEAIAWTLTDRIRSERAYGLRSIESNRLPAVVGECLVGFGHLVDVLTALHRSTEAIACVEQLVREALGHRLLAPLTAVADQRADRQGGGAAGTDFDGDLVGGAADATALDLELRLDVLDRPLQRGDR